MKDTSRYVTVTFLEHLSGLLLTLFGFSAKSWCFSEVLEQFKKSKMVNLWWPPFGNML